MTSDTVSAQPLASLIDRSYRPREPANDDEVWRLNLDQIEPHTGRVLSKCMLNASELGPSTYAFDRGTVLYSKLRPYLNKVVVADNDGVATTELVPLRCDELRLNAQYLAHFLRGPEFLRFATNVVAGAKMPRMVMSEFWKFPVPLPPLPKQRRIAAILDQADALRAKRREALAQLDSLTQSIFIEMFGDPATNPRQWRIGCIADLLESASYGTSEKSASVGEFPVLRMNNLTRSGELDLRDLKYMELPEALRSKYLVRAGDVLFNRTNSADLVGKTAMVPPGTPPLAYAGYLIRLRLNATGSPTYLARFLNTSYAKRTLRGMCKSIIGMANINATEIQAMKIAIPPLALQQTFATRIHAVEALKATHLAALAELDALFASLQHRAFSGTL